MSECESGGVVQSAEFLQEEDIPGVLRDTGQSRTKIHGRI